MGAPDTSLTPAEITAFEIYWSAKRRAVLPARQVLGNPIRLGVRRERGGALWVYYPAGYARILSMGATPVYQVPEPTSFNKLLVWTDSQ